MVRAAFYALHASGNHEAISIEDQFRLCEDRAAQEGWQVVDYYGDTSSANSSIILRPGLRLLLEDARAGHFDIVVTAVLSDMSCDRSDMASLFDRLRVASRPIGAASVGELSDLPMDLGAI